MLGIGLINAITALSNHVYVIDILALHHFLQLDARSAKRAIATVIIMLSVCPSL